MTPTEIERLRDRITQLEAALGVDTSLAGRLRLAFGVEPGKAPILGMLLKREFVGHDALYTVMYAGRPECDWPDEKVLDVQICKLRKVLKPYGINIQTRWGEGWYMNRTDKGKVNRMLIEFEGMELAASAETLKKRRLAFLDGS